MDILGITIPRGGIKGKLAGLALISIPLALVVGAGYAAVWTGKALKRRLNPETEEEYVERMERQLRGRH